MKLLLLGMENMVKFLIILRKEKWTKLGDMKLIDGLVMDSLTDVYNKVHTGFARKNVQKIIISQEKNKMISQ